MKKALGFQRLTAAAAALAAVGLLSAGTAAAAPSGEAAVLEAGKWRGFTQTGFSGPDNWFGPGTTGSCTYVGDNWNDKIRSARTQDTAVRVELWEHANCTGTSITIDDSGYGNIGRWVSAYRVTT
ncbi:peptidase inhibitor family I36 protein [Streptomyces roseirectus]|uniref:Peptidase inhibitor family I36 protein n=1 Tax=Streptomyces roseirectus TaxID=2768066 RepID=A0A7H0IRE7_9ACTN|nr:peptidase inhibitor family I36 protein [Streptomyces roseirectus]QNP75363.1 peptidase inhibitor family I36 protein [Streptomyces roseirectus]